MNSLWRIKTISPSCWVPRCKHTFPRGARYRLRSNGDAAQSIQTALHMVFNNDDVEDVQNVRVLNVQRTDHTQLVDVVSLLRERNVLDILSVQADATAAQASLKESHSVLGNDLGPRVWNGDLGSLPAYMGPFQVVILDADTINGGTLRELLVQCSLMTKPGGSILVWSSSETKYAAGEYEDAIYDLCLEICDISLHVVRLQVPENFALKNGIKYMTGEIVTGFGRGSKKLGVPTANIRPEDVEVQIAGLPSGVYFGWAKLLTSGAQPEADGSVYKMVMNIGNRPTFVKDNSPDISVEVHVMHQYKDDFYGQMIKVIVLGYLRPEMKFENINALLNRIQTDIGISKSQLDGEAWSKFADDPFFG